MPIYEYERQDGTRFEMRQGFHDEALKMCPDTDQPVRRILSPASVIFKGSGWYITDSRPAASSSESGAAASGTPAATTASDTPASAPASTGGDAKTGEAKVGEAKASDAKSGASTAKKSDAAA